MKPTINIIGAGKLGKTLAKLLVDTGAGTLQGICNRSIASSDVAINFIGQGKSCEKIAHLPAADITFVATPDDAIQACCHELIKTANLKSASVIVQFSGMLSSDILAKAKTKNCFIASIHPMQSFADPAISVMQYQGTYCAMEGDEAAISILDPLFKAIGSITYRINSEHKVLYHMGGVFASNYLIAIFEKSLGCLDAAGVSRKVGVKIILSLMQGVVNNLEKTQSPEQSLTGPIARGDAKTIAAHVAAACDPDLLNLYKLVGLATLDVARLSRDTKNEIRDILCDTGVSVDSGSAVDNG